VAAALPASEREPPPRRPLGDPPAASCVLCEREPEVPVVSLRPGEVDSLLESMAAPNAAQIARIDSALQSGAYGPPESARALHQAYLVARLTTWNCYRLLARFAADSTRVVEAAESTLASVYSRYLDPSLFNVVRLRRARLGLGRVCMQYDLEEECEGETNLGGKHLRYRIQDAEIGAEKHRVLSLDLPTGTDDVVEVMLASHYGCAFEFRRSDGPPAPYEAFIVHDIDGGWLRKSGTHRPTAFMFWVTPQDSLSLVPGAEPLAGVRIYIPHLRFKLPTILPDINLDDLRRLELPYPLLALDYVEHRRYPGWMANESGRWIRAWKGHGEVPPEIRARFPDS
jgi:hypothetical protein